MILVPFRFIASPAYTISAIFLKRFFTFFYRGNLIKFIYKQFTRLRQRNLDKTIRTNNAY